MAVNWLWKSEKGYYTLVQKHHFKSGELDLLTGEDKMKTVTRKFKVGLYGGNCLAACIYRYKEVNKETGKKEGYYTFCGFWNDIEHLKRCLDVKHNHKENIYGKEYSSNDYIESIHLNVFYPEMLKVGKLFAEAGIKVILYYKKTR